MLVVSLETFTHMHGLIIWNVTGLKLIWMNALEVTGQIITVLPEMLVYHVDEKDVNIL